MKSPDDELLARRREYKKLLLANHDALEARAYIRRAASFEARESLTDDGRVALAAFTAAFVIAYGRCFASSLDQRRRLPTFGDRFEGVISELQLTLHKRLGALRDQEFAHSDADVSDIHVSDMKGAFLAPVGRILRIHSLSREDLVEAVTLTDTLATFVTAELVRLQGELAGTGEF